MTNNVSLSQIDLTSVKNITEKPMYKTKIINDKLHHFKLNIKFGIYFETTESYLARGGCIHVFNMKGEHLYDEYRYDQIIDNSSTNKTT